MLIHSDGNDQGALAERVRAAHPGRELRTMATAAADTNHGAVAPPVTSAGPGSTTQVALGADVANNLYGVTGAGVTIGVISDSFNATNGAATDMNKGILPSVTVLSDNPMGADEGRAMIEDAYAIAPGAKFLFATDDQSSAYSQTAVTSLQNAGANIISDDFSLDDESFYQTGSPLDDAITQAMKANVNYFTSAGNSGDDYYEQGFKPLQVTIPGIGSSSVTANDFGGGSPYLSLTLNNGNYVDMNFQWAQPFQSYGSGSAQNSLAIYLLDGAGTIVASATNDDVGGNPVQTLFYQNTESSNAFRLVVVQNGGTVPTGQLFKFFDYYDEVKINSPTAGQGSGDLQGHEFLPGVNVVGAVPYYDTPAYGATTVAESFSSVGPGEILFDGQGNALATPLVPNAPQFLATDGSEYQDIGTNGEFSPFYGTSAASPAAAAVAALALQADPGLSTAEVTSVLEQSVIPVQATTAGADIGAGLIQARAAVELATADAGDRWSNGSGGNWGSAGNWSGGTPTNAEAVSVDDNLGAFAGHYTVTVNTPGNVAGSIAIAAPAGSSSTLTVALGGALAVGGSSAANRTAGDLLVSDRGTLSVTGGSVSLTGSLNLNNGTVTESQGTVSANNFTENAGSLSVGGGLARLTLTGVGVFMTGGSASVLAAGTLHTTSLTDSLGSFSNAANGTVQVDGAALFTNEVNFTDSGAFTTAGALNFDSSTATVATSGVLNVGSLGVGYSSNGESGTLTDSGRIIDSGTLTVGSAVAGGTLNLQGGSSLSVGGGYSSVTIVFNGNADLSFTTTDESSLTNLDGYIEGLAPGNGAIDFTGLAYNAADTIGYNSGSGQFDIFAQNGTALVQGLLGISTNYTGELALADNAGHLELNAVACFLKGTRIRTPRGEVAVEALAIGDEVNTLSGMALPIRWIGRRRYGSGASATVMPIRISAGALGVELPCRDLWVSPEHAMYLQGTLIPARALVNQHSIEQETGAQDIEYFHLEFAQHTVIFAEGAPTESFADDASRQMFDNAVEFKRLYPTQGMPQLRYCAPRIEEGWELALVLRQLAFNAHCGPPTVPRPFGSLRPAWTE